MTAVEAAVQRGLEARSKKSRWEPVGVDYPGWLTARVKDLRSGEVEGVFFAQGKWQLTRLGRDKEGRVRSFDVRDRELRKIVKAMLQPSKEERDELIAECAAARRKRSSDGGARKKKRTRRGKT